MIRRLETSLTDTAAALIPWLAPLPSAWLVGQASIEHLRWPLPIAIAAAVIIEGLGLSSTSTALELREYNAAKRKTDPAAPAWLAAILAGVYLITTIGLTVLLDLAPSLAHIAPAIFPGLSLVGAVLLALRADHRRRLVAVAQDKAERRAMRQNAAHHAAHHAPVRRNAGATCAQCGAELANQQALAAHMRWKHPQPVAIGGNGHHAQEIEQP